MPWIPFDVADVYGDGDGRYADYGRFGAALAVEVSVEVGAMWGERGMKEKSKRNGRLIRGELSEGFL